jgi:hydroxymethylpyrimidine pyrophosphatase-like HAD family hydrolase
VLAHQWPVHIAVGENGAGWVAVHEGKVHEGYYHPPDERRAQHALLERVRHAVAERMPQVRTACDQRARRCDLAFDVGEQARLSASEIDTLVQWVESEGAQASVSSVHVHVIPGQWDKARGVVQAVQTVWGIDLRSDPERRQRWCFVGDSGNDAAAFAFFPWAVGVRNVEPHLGRLAATPAWVTRNDRGQGFAELATLLLRARNERRTGR